jgi:hypothetical protein
MYREEIRLALIKEREAKKYRTKAAWDLIRPRGQWNLRFPGDQYIDRAMLALAQEDADKDPLEGLELLFK